MSATTPPPTDDSVTMPDSEPTPARSSGSRRQVVARWTRRAFALVVALLAALFVSFFSLDLGRIPQLRELAERGGTTYLRRPLHIGSLSARITPGRFVLEDVVIEGRNPGDRPFFSARRIVVNVLWSTLLRSEVHLNVRLDDWSMVVESWADGTHNLPRLAPGPRESPTPRRFTTTVDYAYAHGGTFTYEDHGTPWSVVAPNLSFDLVRSTAFEEYVGTASFTGGVVRIQDFEPMSTDLRTRFELDGALVRLRHIDLVADGSESHIAGQVALGSEWPNQFYDIESTVDFARMKALFFAREDWRVRGQGEFTGRFALGKGGVRDLTGSFASSSAIVNDVSFSSLRGDLTWLPAYFGVSHARADVLGGQARFSYSITPRGTAPGSTMTFDVDYSDLDLFELDRVLSLRGLRFAGSATGSLAMQWPSGGMSTGRRGIGHTLITPLSDRPLAPDTLPAAPLAPAPEAVPFDPSPIGRPILVGADLHYRFEPGLIVFDDSQVATTHSYIAFSGQMEPGGPAEFPFHVTSHDWQESDRLLAAIMTAVGGPTRAVEVGGRGTFDGVMTGTFSSPRIEGQFTGEDVRAWDVRWGRARADLVIEGGYVDIRNSRIGDGTESFILADGRYALGYRPGEAEEIRAQVEIQNWPIADLRHAFQLDDWPMDGRLAALTLDLRGRYRTMFGSGRMRIEDGRAWGESFDVATADLALEGTGLRVSGIELAKGPGRMLGAARIGWDGTYAFDADGEGVPVESLDNFRLEVAPLSGRLRFEVTGAGTFEAPSYSFDASVDDLFVGDEGVGAVSGRVSIADRTMTIERLVAASSRLQLLGSGRITFDDDYTSDLRVRFQETSIDPYLKFLLTDDISPYARLVVGGAFAVTGPLARPASLSATATIDDASFTLYDYELTNEGPLQLNMSDGQVAVTAFELRGSNTNLRLGGGVDIEERTLGLTAEGDAGMAILQLFFEGITAAGGARLNAALSGTFDAPMLTGDASIVDGRLRPLGSPHSVEDLNGSIRFASNAIYLEDVHGRIGAGDVAFGGSIALDGYRLADYNLTADGRSMRLRYPAGFNSTIDMRLFLTGPPDAPLLTGTIDVLRVALIGAVQPGTGLLGFATATAAGSTPAAVSSPAVSEGTPLALDIQVTAPRMRMIDNNAARIDASADLQVRGTFSAPTIDGAVEIAGGEVLFNGNRYFVREGSVDFNPGDPDPVFDLAAETRPRLSGQSFTVNVGISGTFDRINFTTSSDPWLPDSDIISLLFGGTPAWETAEERSLRSSQELQQQMLQTAGAALLASPLTSRVGAAVESTGAFDTVQITPILTNEVAFQQLNPTARVTFGKRVSPRVFLTYSRTIGGLEEEIILLEYDQSDRMSWVLSRNEDRTFALDFRIRYVF